MEMWDNSSRLALSPRRCRPKHVADILSQQKSDTAAQPPVPMKIRGRGNPEIAENAARK
jgi:hypothetical protein